MLERFGYKNLVAVVYMAALFLQIMDGTIMNVALPTLAEHFDVEATSMDWIVLSFTIALGVMTASAGWFGDRFGAKRIFLIALGGFVVTSMMCGASQSLDQLVVGRALQGAFAGLITPIGSALLFNAFPVEERSVASRKVITVAVIAPAMGPVIGGAIIEVLSWRWIFFVNIPVGTLALLAGSRWLEREEPVDTGRFDVSGFILLVSGLGLGLYGLSRGGRRGWGSAPIVVALVAGVIFLVLLVLVELRRDEPILELRLLQDRIFRISNIVALPTYAGFMGLLYLLPLFLQDEGGRTALQVGLATFPQALGVLVMSQIAGRFLYRQFGPRRLIVAGATAAMIVGIAVSRLEPSANLSLVRALMFGRGLAMGLIMVPLQTAVFASMSKTQMSRATAIYGASRQIAPAVGVALASTVLATGLAGTVVGSAARPDAYQAAFLATALLFGLAAVLALFINDSDAAATMAKDQPQPAPKGVST